MLGQINRRNHFQYSPYNYQNFYNIRQQPYLNYLQPQWNLPPNWAPNQPSYQPSISSYPPAQQPWQPMQQSPYNANYTEAIFQNPLQPNEEMNPYVNINAGNMGYMHQYPKQSFNPGPPSGMQSVLNSFKAQDGSLDFNKMMDTAGSMVNAVSQVSAMVKGLGGMFKA